LADWSIELIKHRQRKGKAKKEAKRRAKGRCSSECSVQTDETRCEACEKNMTLLTTHQERISKYKEERERMKKLFVCDDSESDIVIVDSVEQVLREAAEVRAQVEKLKNEMLKMEESLARQLAERDRAHSERVRTMEIGMVEKEKHLMQSSNQLRQQLAAARQETHKLQRQVSLLEQDKQTVGGGYLEDEVASLRQVLAMRREEADQLKAANNSLVLELERLAGLEVQLQVQCQKVEEMEAVVGGKNEQLRQVLDEYDQVQHQLEVEVAAHLACQQELEKIQWSRENVLQENAKRWKEISNQQKSGLILDVIQKDSALAYSFNC